MKLKTWNFNRKPDSPIAWLIVGLGNPGKKYAQTRHNVGFHIADRLADAAGIVFDRQQHGAMLARGNLDGVPVMIAKPQTFMNLSGKAVAPLARFYKIPPERIFVIFDDLDLPPAHLRIRLKGGAGGHKGMRSIIDLLGTKDFPRMRVGIGRPAGQMPVEAYVLQAFSSAEWEEMLVTYARAVNAVRTVVTEGVETAMNKFN